MAAMILRVRVWIGRRWLRLVITAVVIGIAAGLAMGVAAGTRRTDSAPDRYTRWAGGDPDLLITQQSGPPLDARVGALPGVVSTTTQVFVPSFLVSPIDGTPLLDPTTYTGDDDSVGTRLVAGRFTNPAEPDEFTVNRSMAALLSERFGTHVGDRFQIVSYSQAQVDAHFATIDHPSIPAFTGTLVGVTESPTQFDDPSPQMVLSRAFLRAHPDVGVVQTQIATYLAAGTDAAAVIAAVHAMPNGADAFASPLPVVSANARRAVRFQVTALWIVTALTAIAAAIVIAQVVGRAVRMSDDEHHSMRALGWRRVDIAAERAAEGAAIGIVAAPLAVAVAFAVSSRFPLGVLRSFEPDPGWRFDWPVSIIGVVVLGAAAVATGAVVGLHRTRAAGLRRHVAGVTRLGTLRGAGMPLSVGARFASSGRGNGQRAWGSLVAGALGVAGLIGSVVVGASLTRIVDHPDRWGVDYQYTFGNPYTPAENDIVSPVAADPDVVAVTGAHVGSVTIDGSDTATLAFRSAKGDLVPTVLHGREPATDNEIGIGAEVARRLHVGIGDNVQIAGSSGTTAQAKVVGIIVNPNSAGNGAAMTFDGYRKLSPEATVNILLVDFRTGTSNAAIDAIAAANYTPPDSSVPPSIHALGRVTATPFLLGAVLGLLLLFSCAYVSATSARSRRRDLAILRALGSEGRQLRAVVHWQSTLVAVAIMIVGIPIGIVVGRWIVTLLTDTLGIVPGTEVPVLTIAAGVVGAIAIANVLAVLPAHRVSDGRIGRLTTDR